MLALIACATILLSLIGGAEIFQAEGWVMSILGIELFKGERALVTGATPVVDGGLQLFNWIDFPETSSPVEADQ